MCRVLFIDYSLSSFWGHSVHFAKFPILRFSQGYFCHSFHPISTKLCRRVQAFLVIGQILKVYGTFKISYLIYIAIIHKSMWFHLAKKIKQSVKEPGPFVVVIVVAVAVVVVVFCFCSFFFSRCIRIPVLPSVLP